MNDSASHGSPEIPIKPSPPCTIESVPEATNLADKNPDEKTTAQACKVRSSKPPLNRRSRRRLARNVTAVNHIVRTHNAVTSDRPLLELKRVLDKPPGTSFLGSEATQTIATVNGLEDQIPIIIDSGSDITLISQGALDNLSCKMKKRVGQNINLIQVTGSATISEFVSLDLYFHTLMGPVKIAVEAYIVKDEKNAPFCASGILDANWR
ncbi:hypothetical protein VKT23_001366 [Stygiomarasmius scandens]|uniref:Peptidase A2 domain-containing protein n=1 Tax=Marasmiellus scandens TaxID=2682957 RepID=A0ABR1K0A2_9AGAR